MNTLHCLMWLAHHRHVLPRFPFTGWHGTPQILPVPGGHAAGSFYCASNPCP